MQPHTSQKKLRRLAPRAVRVLSRHKDKQPGLAAFEGSLAPSATAFIAAYDTADTYSAERVDQSDESTSAVATLVKKLRIWAPQVARDVKDVDTRDFGESPNVPDDVINDVKRLIEHAARRDGTEGPLSYSEALAADLGAALEAARVEWDQAEQASDGYAEAQRLARQTAATFERDLIAFRRAVRAVVGRGHPDYQKLRREKARLADPEDDPNAPPAEPIDPDELSEPANSPGSEEAESA